MAGRLAGKVALLTAAAAGIGRATAEAFAREGARVVATDIRTSPGLRRASTPTSATSSTSARPRLVEALAREIGPVDILFNCAGFVHHGTVLTTSDADWDFLVRSSTPSRCTGRIRSFLPGMLEKGRGSIVQRGLRRLLGARHPQPLCLRHASKAAVIGLTKSGRCRLHPQGRALQRHLPWHDRRARRSTASRIETLSKSSGEPLETVRQAFIDRQPMGRLGQPEEVAALAVYLASDESAFTTGQAYLVDELICTNVGLRSACNQSQ